MDQTGEHGIGPNLYGVFGRKIASATDYEFSESLMQRKEVWDENNLNRYIARPKLLAPGNAMPFPGITSRHTRSALINWLKTNPEYSDPPASDFTQMVADADTVRGASVGQRCLVCHSIDTEGHHSIGPNLRSIVGRKIAGAPNFDYSERMLRLEGTWTIDALYRFLIAPKAFDQGSHSAFRSLTSPMDRAALIAWMNTID